MDIRTIVCQIGVMILLWKITLDLISFFNIRRKAKRSGYVSFVQDNRKVHSIITGVIWLFCYILNISSYSTINRGLAPLQLLLGIANIEQGITYGVFVAGKDLYYHKSLYQKRFIENFRTEVTNGEICFYIKRHGKKKDTLLFRFDNTRINQRIFRYFLNGDGSASIYSARLKKRYIVISGVVILSVMAIISYMGYM